MPRCLSLLTGVALLLTACAAAQDKPLTPPPMCSSNPTPGPAKIVMVTLDAGGVATPSNCVVRSGTQVIWQGPGAALPFMLNFDQSPGNPAAQWTRGPTARFQVDDPARQFTSHLEDGQQRVRLTAKEVTAPVDIDYCVALEMTCVDPGIKIVPR